MACAGQAPTAAIGGDDMMGGVRVGLLGTEAAAGGGSDDDDVLAGGDPPGTLGVNGTVAMSTGKIEDVRKDWDPDSPKFTDPIVVSGVTIDQVLAALNHLPEWGKGGGVLKLQVPDDFSSSHSVTLSANLVRRLPQWKQYDHARDAEKAAWNHMFRKLTDHEDRHVEIAVEEARKLADDLIGQTTAEAAKTVRAANRRLEARQKKLDDETDHGAKPGVKYGDVIMDLSRT
jgi:hypothetical protein